MKNASEVPNVLYQKLSNGLQLIGEQNPHATSAAIGFFVKTGSRDEAAVESGVSHFLEHMMFKGTEKRNALDITFQLGNIGAQANAYTSEENTVFYGGIVPEYFSDMQELLSDMLRPSIVDHEFTTEKQVILEEIALYKDRPQFYLFENAIKDFFGTHPAGNSVLGSTESISALSRDQMKQYFDRRYVPSTMTLVAAGKFDWDLFVTNAEKYCSSWKGVAPERTLTRYANTARYVEYKKKNLTQAHVVFMTTGCGAQDPERYALSLLSIILGDSSGSRLYWELVDTGIAESAGAESDERDGTGMFIGYACTEPGKIDQVSGVVKKVLETPLEFTDEELNQAKMKCVSRIVLGGEAPMGRLMAIGSEWNARKKVESLKEVADKIRSVSRSDIEKALQKFPLKTWSEYRLLPE